MRSQQESKKTDVDCGKEHHQQQPGLDTASLEVPRQSTPAHGEHQGSHKNQTGGAGNSVDRVNDGLEKPVCRGPRMVRVRPGKEVAADDPAAVPEQSTDLEVPENVERTDLKDAGAGHGDEYPHMNRRIDRESGEWVSRWFHFIHRPDLTCPAGEHRVAETTRKRRGGFHKAKRDSTHSLRSYPIRCRQVVPHRPGFLPKGIRGPSGPGKTTVPLFPNVASTFRFLEKSDRSGYSLNRRSLREQPLRTRSCSMGFSHTIAAATAPALRPVHSVLIRGETDLGRFPYPTSRRVSG